MTFVHMSRMNMEILVEISAFGVLYALRKLRGMLCDRKNTNYICDTLYKNTKYITTNQILTTTH
jgi:hypothetical protein